MYEIKEKEPNEILCFTCIFYRPINAQMICLARRLKDGNNETTLAFICEDYSEEDKSPLPDFEFANADFSLIEKEREENKNG